MMNPKRILALLAVVAGCADIQAPLPPISAASARTDARIDAPFITSAVSATEWHACAIAPGSNLQCWGWNSNGQIGNGTTGGIVETPVHVGQFEQVSVGGFHTCALDRDGQAFCWGLNRNGALGTGNDVDSPVPVPVNTSLRFTDIQAGNSFTCALTAEGTAWCWGSGGHGTLGVASPEICARASGFNSPCAMSPVAVSGGHAFTQLDVGLWNGCGITADGAAWCWGNNFSGQLGDGSIGQTGIVTPVAVQGGLAFQTISVGGSHMCGLTTSSQIYCWGDNTYGALGDGTNTARLVPTLSAGGSTFASVVAGDGNVFFNHTCATETDGTLYCWGSNSAGQLGVSSALPTCRTGRFASPCSSTPIAVETDLRFDAIDLGSQITCGVADRKAYCFGSNEFGALGNPTVEISTSTPTPVATWMKGRGRGAAQAHAPRLAADE